MEIKKRKRIAVFASGNGSNLQAILNYSKKNDINGDVVMVFPIIQRLLL